MTKPPSDNDFQHAFGLALAPVAPRPELRGKLLEKMRLEPRYTPASVTRAGEGAWTATGIPGVDYKNLYTDGATRRVTMLLRMAPGAMFPTHHHHDPEQCWVLEGDVRWGDLVFKKGDFVVSGQGSTHPTIVSDSGNILLLVAGHYEFLR
jgi:anti-sigma factor ChrR (cupin superfamily)